MPGVEFRRDAAQRRRDPVSDVEMKVSQPGSVLTGAYSSNHKRISLVAVTQRLVLSTAAVSDPRSARLGSARPACLDAAQST